MATVNKDFKIKSGLIVEGLQGTINGNTILTENAGDQYILDLIGGETLVKSVEATQLEVNGAGKLSVKAEVFDDFGSASDAQAAAALDATAKADAAEAAAKLYADGLAEGVAGDLSDHEALTSGVHGVTGSVVGTTDTQDISNKRIIDTLNFSDGATIANEGEIEILPTSHVFNIQANLGDLNLKTVATGASVYVISEDADIVLAADGGSYIGTVAAANEIATKGYADIAADGADTSARGYADGLISTEVSDRNAAIATAKGEAIAAAEDYTDTAVANVVGAAPELLDTLNELAAALQDNPDIIADLQDVAAGKQDTLTAGSNIDITGATISVTGLDTDDVSEGTNLYFTNQRALNATSAAYDIAGAADTAYNNAVSDAAFDATSKANTAQTNATNYTDQEISSEVTNRNTAITNAVNALTTSDIEEGSNLYFTDYAAKVSAVDLLTNATKENIEITWTNQGGLVIAAENGVAGSTTDDLVEGATNLYFQDERAFDAVENTNIRFETVEITWVRREEATWTGVPNASTATVHSFGQNKGSVKYLVRVISNSKSHVTELLVTTDSSNNVAVVEYGTIYTSENPLATATVVWNSVTSQYDLNVTTAENNAEVLVAATLLAYND